MKTVCHRILYIEDDIALGRLLQKRLSAKSYDVTVMTTANEGIAALTNGDYDLVLLDNFLPDLEGVEVLTALQPLEERPPILLLTASGDERLAVDALEKGAADYVVKDAGLAYIDLLPAVMQAAHARFRLAGENRIQREELRVAWEKAEVANRAKTAFLSAISHEIRTPLNVIIGATTLLDKTILQENQKVLTTTLKSNAELLLGLVNDTLDLNKVEAGAMTLESLPLTAGMLIDEMKRIFGPAIMQKGLEFETRDDTGTAQWLGDFLRIKQILVNLISNASKFTDKGKIALTAGLADNKCLQFSVADTGIGIPPDKQAMIFESFSQADQSTTRHYGGTGLGLALVRAMVHLMDGEIKLDSAVGRGTSFTVMLPLKKAHGLKIDTPAAVAPEKAEYAHPPGTQQNILLVEDYPANAMVAQMMLQDMGYKVVWAASGAEAIEAVKKAGEPFRAVLMDIQMQDMDGYATTRELRILEKNQQWSQPIIGLTAHALQDEAERCRNAGMNDYLSKPVNWALLKDKLDSL